jgi:hypothetical protein
MLEPVRAGAPLPAAWRRGPAVAMADTAWAAGSAWRPGDRHRSALADRRSGRPSLRIDFPNCVIDKEAQAPVAQLDRAPDYESGGQEFESLRARQTLSRWWVRAQQVLSSLLLRQGTRHARHSQRKVWVFPHEPTTATSREEPG